MSLLTNKSILLLLLTIANVLADLNVTTQAPSTATPTITLPPAPTIPPTVPPPGLTEHQIAGIVIGCVIAAIACLVMAIYTNSDITCCFRSLTNPPKNDNP
jgi:hypothetical protein